MKYNLEAIRLMLMFSDVLDSSSGCRKNNEILLFISIKFCYLVNSTDQSQLVVLNINKSSDQQLFNKTTLVQPREKMKSRHCYFKHLTDITRSCDSTIPLLSDVHPL